ncbi:hypothetical protein E3E31_09380 [Thermococcus sp. M39]|uniref:PCNA-inhibitor n=1 Tax=unclassified Thermococcus TaxID=2627626 RepID=UPI00143B1132|nr:MULTISPECIES: PCNA-inhibitor [unclassified Thermococcus]NJE08729.1 hypothetical protein [Thermococcus sp. M39]NJE12970.1 hypothetical protein [Thermococcus sp. LS2]
MDKKLDEFITSSVKISKEKGTKTIKKKRLRPTKLDSFLPEDHINYFKALRIGSKKIRNAKISEVTLDE